MMRKFSKISNYKPIFEKNVVESVIDYCEDITQELIDDLQLINIMSHPPHISWSNFWETENGWYHIYHDIRKNDEIDDFFNLHYFKVVIELCINKKVLQVDLRNVTEGKFDISKYAASIRNRLYTKGYITTYDTMGKPNSANSSAINFKINIYGK